MNDHLYKKLKRLFDARTNGANELDEYRRGIVSAKVKEEDLKAEIERRGK